MSLPATTKLGFDNCAIDFTSMGDENGIFCDFEKTVEFRWLLKNCHKYNFWIPYFPDEKGVANSTRKDGMAVEAWHYEYRTDAEDLMNQNKVVDLFQKKTWAIILEIKKNPPSSGFCRAGVFGEIIP
jgi:hypothetical protein